MRHFDVESAALYNGNYGCFKRVDLTFGMLTPMAFDVEMAQIVTHQP